MHQSYFTPQQMNTAIILEPLKTFNQAPDIFDVKTEANEFKKFLHLIENSDNMNKSEIQKHIRNCISMKIPEMRNSGQLKKLYIKTFLQSKKYIH